MPYTPGVDTVILSGPHEVLLAMSVRTLAPLPAIIWRPPLLIHNIKEVLPGEPEVFIVEGGICGELEQYEGDAVDGEWEVSVVL